MERLVLPRNEKGEIILTEETIGQIEFMINQMVYKISALEDKLNKIFN